MVGMGGEGRGNKFFRSEDMARNTSRKLEPQDGDNRVFEIELGLGLVRLIQGYLNDIRLFSELWSSWWIVLSLHMYL